MTEAISLKWPHSINNTDALTFSIELTSEVEDVCTSGVDDVFYLYAIT